MHNTRVSTHQHQQQHNHHHHNQQQQQQNAHHQQKHQHSSSTSSSAMVNSTRNFTNTAKLPIETVKLLIAAVSRKPHLWIRTNNGQKRSDINALWHQVSQEVHLPAEICRIKWGHLRDNFRKVFIRNTLSAEPPTTWRFYNDMRFMEPAVAENVMRHHRLREQSLYWQELHNAGQQRHQATTPNLASEAKYEHPLQTQLNFSDFAAMFQSSANVANKRIKLEVSDTSQTSMQDSMSMNFNAISNEKFYTINHNNVHQSDVDEQERQVEEEDDEDDDDDDQFDEDAVSAEESLSNVNGKQSHNEKETNNHSEVNLSNFIMRQDAATNTESGVDLAEEDSERMFLLSLLPYLRKVKDQRKLQVRQKLQDVLIEEFG